MYATGTFGTTTYLSSIPSAQTGGACNNNYTYAPNSAGDNYTLNFCLEDKTGTLSKGINFAKAGSVGKDPSLLLHYALDEGTGSLAIDSSGNSRNGDYFGTGSHWASGKYGPYSGSVNYATNTSDYIRSPAFSFTSSENQTFTMNMWVWRNSNESFLTLPVLFQQNGQSPSNHFILIYSSVASSNLYLQVTTGTVIAAFQNTDYFLNQFNKWIMFTLVFDYNNNIAVLYRDGQYITTWTGTNDWMWPNQSSYKNFSGYYSSQRWSGYLDDIRIYDKALTSGEVLAIYNSTK